MSNENPDVDVAFCTGCDVSAAGCERLPDPDRWPNQAVLGSLLGALLCAFSSAAQARTVNAASPSLTDVRRAILSAVHGDTVIVPAGTAAWTSGLTITKAITIQGQTTTDVPNGTANDQTILTDHLPRGSGEGYFRIATPTGTLVRITGITFSGQGGIQTIMSGGAIRVNDRTPCRVDHCHFTHLNHSTMIAVYSTNFGVADHNVMDDFTGQNFSFYINFPNYGGYQYGDGAFAEAAGFGGPKFYFIEDNYIYFTSWGGGGGGSLDAFYGGKYVFRHNRMFNATTLGHSTGHSHPRGRGVRAQEIYNNEWHMNNPGTIDGTTGGSMVTHDNSFYGALQKGFGLAVYRAFWSFGAPFYGADGNNAWDYNATEADGTHVDGHSPYLFESGTLTSASYPNLTDSTKNWTPGQWRGYKVRRPSDSAMGVIEGNTNNTLSIAPYLPINFAAGNQYQIHKVLRILDQPGTGRGDRINGNPPVNTVSGTATWPRPDTEPCYSWNNIHSPSGEHVNFDTGLGAYTIVQGRDYFIDTPMPGYTPYTYPHPLVSGVPPPASATRDSQRNLNKNKERKVKKIKKWKWGKTKKNSANKTAKQSAPDQ